MQIRLVFQNTILYGSNRQEGLMLLVVILRSLLLRAMRICDVMKEAFMSSNIA